MADLVPATPGGDRPVLVLTRDPVAEGIQSVVVAALTRTTRNLVSELLLSSTTDAVPSDCVVSFDNLHTFSRQLFRHRVVALSDARTRRPAMGGQTCAPPISPLRSWLPRQPSESTKVLCRVGAGSGHGAGGWC